MPREWADRYAGQFDEGWDAYRVRAFAWQQELGIMPAEPHAGGASCRRSLMPADAELSRHDPDVPAWESLSPDARRLAARMMEVFAGFLSHTDYHLGRVIDFLKETGQFGRHELRFESEPTGEPDFLAGKGAPGQAQLYVDGRLAGQAEFPVTTPIGLNPGGLTCGSYRGAARRWWRTTGRRSASP